MIVSLSFPKKCEPVCDVDVDTFHPSSVCPAVNVIVVCEVRERLHVNLLDHVKIDGNYVKGNLKLVT
ncbi:unnamed protein product [Onchocerca flexuosa]|uniref:Uncharacterized protein n=1 Tax=Onchocerca flexuosa TaxID=387005 RepID=A0A183HIZ9_9BILA|nr:unnamed protein product [Onchocerca flexuosa]